MDGGSVKGILNWIYQFSGFPEYLECRVSRVEDLEQLVRGTGLEKRKRTINPFFKEFIVPVFP